MIRLKRMYYGNLFRGEVATLDEMEEKRLVDEGDAEYVTAPASEPVALEPADKAAKGLKRKGGGDGSGDAE